MSKNTKSPRKKHNLIKMWQNNKDHISWIVEQGKGFRKYIAGFLAINMVSMLVSIASSVAGKYVVDAATGFNTDMFWSYILIMLLTTLVTISLSFVSTLFSGYVGEKFAFSIRAEMFDRVQRSKWFEISKFRSGDILSRLTGDINTLAGAIINIVPTVIVAFVQFVLVLIILLKNDPLMAVIGLVVGPLGLVIGTVFRKKFVKYQKELRESESEYYSFFQETLSNISVTKAFQTEEDNNTYFRKIRKQRLSLVMKTSRLSAFMHVCMSLVYHIGYVVAFSLCAYRLSRSDGSYTYGTMTLFLSLVAMLQSTIKGMGTIIPHTFSSVVAARRIRAIADIENENYEKVNEVPCKVGLHIEDVAFTYENIPVLRDISFDVMPGERIGIVGSSGAGKTTLIRLLLALTVPDSGQAEYVLEGESAETISPASRRFIAYVPQGNTLSSGTVRSNLQTALKDATESQMWKALDIACATDFLGEDTQGLDTVIGENAGGISEGQAQRICIARALLRNKPVLILDEATSALDEDTERKIFEALSTVENKTCFIITHRRSMLRYCDRVLEIEDSGRVHIRKSDCR